MLDYAKWLQRAVAFTGGLCRLPKTIDYAKTGKHESGAYQIKTSVAPPLSEEEVRALAKSCRLPIPEALRRFWIEASGLCLCTYWWNTPEEFHHQLKVALRDWHTPYISGGPEFSSPQDIVSLPDDFVSWADSFREQGFPKDARFCEHSIPFIHLDNGDYVGLYVRDNADDPPVAYLCHEGCGGSGLIAPNFDAFLASWEQLGYLGIDFLWSFVNEKTVSWNRMRFPRNERRSVRFGEGKAGPTW